MSSDIPREFAPRLCHVVRWADFQGYGFNLHAEKGKAGQFIGKVDESSPAEASGLKEGDRIVEVNGVNIGNENHQQVVTRIKQGGDETRLLVVDSASDEWFKTNKGVIKGDLSGIVFGTARRDLPVEEPEAESEPEPEPEPEVEPEPEPEPVVKEEEEVVEEVATAHVEEVVETAPVPVTNGNGVNEDDHHRPRLCHVRLWPSFQGYGFNLHAERDKPGQFIGLVDDDSPSQSAGLRVNDRIIEVNGKNIEKEPHTTVITYIKETPGEARLLVVDPETDTYYRSKGVTVHSAMTQVHYIATPEVPDAIADLEADADLDDYLPPPPPEEELDSKPEVDDKTDDDDIVDEIDAAIPVVPEPEPETLPEPETVPEPEVEEEKVVEENNVVEEEKETLEVVPEQEVEDNSDLDEPAAAPEVEETVNGVKKQEVPSVPEPEFTVAKEPEVAPAPKQAPAPAPEQPKAPSPDDDGLMLNMSVAEMKERLKAKKKQDPRHNKVSFERKYQQFERM